MTVISMIGPLGPAQLACFGSWRRLGLRTQFIHTETKPLGRIARGIADHYLHLGPVADEPQSFDAIGDHLSKTASAHLACLADQMSIRLWRHRQRLGPSVTLLMAPVDVIEAMESKCLQIEIARQCGFDVLPTALVSAANLAEWAHLSYPIVVRPDRASIDSSFKVAFLADAAALNAFVRSRETRAPAIVAQTFVSGPTVVVHGFRGIGMPAATLIGFVVALKNDGVTVTLEPCDLTREITDACQRFVAAAGLVGVFHFELLLDPTTAKLWFLEVNARLGGTTGKVVVAGYDEPAALLYAFGVIPLAPNAPKSYKAVVSRLAAFRCIDKAIRGKGSPVDYPFPDARLVAFRALRSMVLYRDEVLRPFHPRSTLAFLSQYISR